MGDGDIRRFSTNVLEKNILLPFYAHYYVYHYYYINISDNSLYILRMHVSLY